MLDQDLTQVQTLVVQGTMVDITLEPVSQASHHCMVWTVLENVEDNSMETITSATFLVNILVPQVRHHFTAVHLLPYHVTD